MAAEDQSPVELLEASQIQWKRDFDALLVGFAFGALTGILAVMSVIWTLASDAR